MFCTKCGAQNPDNAAFCDQCGSSLAEQLQAAAPAQPVQPVASPIDLQKPGQGMPGMPAQPVQPVQPGMPAPPMQPGVPGMPGMPAQPVQPGVPNYNAGQPVYGQQPQQYQQPVPGMQPGFAAPVYAQGGAPKKSKTVPIVIAAVSAVIVAFLIVLFTVILPGLGPKGKLRHKWTTTDGSITMTYDFKKNTVSTYGISLPISWDIKGEDHIIIEMSMLGETETLEYIYSISDDGKTLRLKDPDYPSSYQDFTRS